MEIIPLYLFIFIAIYAQVFLSMVLLENWESIFEISDNEDELENYPSVVIAVPCWNETKTVDKTVQSLLALDYPKDKLKLWLIDDGSTDNTWEILQNYKDHPRIEIRTKENGGKHTAVNYVIENSEADIFGCLDADSYVMADTLKNMIRTFIENPEAMAVTPLMIVKNPKGLLQAMQSVEYNMGLIMKRIFSSINAIHVTPGPFSLFRKEVFSKIGLYKKAHNTEDMEFAFRMQKNHLKIMSSTNAYVETSTPDTVLKLYKQRLRWSQGFLQNSIDYKDIILRPKYGNVALFTIPLGWVGIVMVLYTAFYGLYHLVNLIINKIQNYRAIGFDFNFAMPNFANYFDILFLNTNTVAILAVPLFISGITFILMGHHMSRKGSRSYIYIVYFLFLWSFLVPIWMAKAMWGTLTRRSSSWR